VEKQEIITVLCPESCSLHLVEINTSQNMRQLLFSLLEKNEHIACIVTVYKCLPASVPVYIMYILPLYVMFYYIFIFLVLRQKWQSFDRTIWNTKWLSYSQIS